ncbi:CDP-glucose 4,6-dehydratase [Chitinophaga oryziterrae]|uniref:CDP-glucose 4,6-dehydratase n=1 Tax=Chitinophaga oryziterrae TaxID=1031224 RepID=A0A6N8JCU3_9BACT|nr:CDP-glucose 4,6-dehydratase [Chitinophaga oryziterrae]MVT42166.1 CDP-glucose 4,6-dehydratase [Chitinophaga oryziterrae]
MVRLQDFYKDKKVFLTGHTGFKGAWMAAWLQQSGAIVKGYALPPEYDNGVYDYIRPADSVLDDIRNKLVLNQAIQSFQPDFIFHLAAQPLVRRSYEIPAETFDVNVTGTANVLEAANNLLNPCTIVVITTDKVYENKEQDILYKEGDALGGHDPYSASKACAELVVSSFRNSFSNKAIASVRAGNVIGGGDWNKDRIIPDIVRALSNGQVIEVRNPVSVRPWQHVLEPIGGYLRLGALLQQDPAKYAKAYNFGPAPDDHLTVKELVEKAIAIWGNGQWKDASKPGQLHEATLLKLDISLAKKELQWTPKLNAAQAIEWTINWYKQPAANRQAYTIQQINEYMQ